MKKRMRILLAVALAFCVATFSIGCQPVPSGQEPGISIPGGGTETPDPEVPGSGTETPDPEVPGGGTETPDPEVPGGGTETPDPEVPGDGTETPDPEVPGGGTDTPDPEVPGGGTDTPDPEVPGGGTETPDPEVPGGGTDTPDPEVSLPEIEGYTCVRSELTYATGFFGSYAYVETEEGGFLMDRSGELIPSVDLKYVSCKQDKYVTTKDGRAELVHVVDGTLLQGSYSRIEYEGMTALAFTQTQCHTFDLTDPTTPVAVLETTDVEIVSDGCLRIDGQPQLSDLDGNDLVYSHTSSGQIRKYKICEPLAEDFWIITDKNQFGYARSDGGVFIKPQFLQASPFCDGKAIVLSEMGEWQLLDQSGAVLYQTMPEFFEGGYRIVDAQGPFVLLGRGEAYSYVNLDSAEQVVHALPFVPSDPRIYEGLIIDDAGKQVFSLSQGAVVYEGFTRLTLFEGGLIAETPSDGMSLLDPALRVLASGVDILDADGRSLLVRTGNGYACYSVASSSGTL